MTAYESLLEKINDTEIKYLKGSFPIRYQEETDTFLTSDGLTIKFSILGAAYIAERNTKYTHKQIANLVRNKLWVEFEMLANAAMYEIKGSGKNLIFAMYNGEVVGILRHYNMISHLGIISILNEKDLSREITGWTMNEQYMSVDVRVRESRGAFEGDDLKVGIRIINGHSGHVALKYQVIIQARGYEHVEDLKNRARHLSNVSSVMTSMESALAEVRAIRIDIRLADMHPIVLVNMINRMVPTKTVRQEALMHILDSADCETALDVFTTLGQYANTRGYKSAVTTLLNPVISEILK